MVAIFIFFWDGDQGVRLGFTGLRICESLGGWRTPFTSRGWQDRNEVS